VSDAAMIEWWEGLSEEDRLAWCDVALKREVQSPLADTMPRHLREKWLTFISASAWTAGGDTTTRHGIKDPLITFITARC
jgi:hypothetical protein